MPDREDLAATAVLQAEAARPGRRRRFGLLRHLGPGLISGAADDDPSGIVTYSQAGAQLGYAACWVLLACYPLIVATQEISARIGRVTGGGIIANLRRRYPAWLIAVLAALIVLTNTINLGADLGAMADVMQLLLGGPRLAYVVLWGGLCAGSLLCMRLGLYIRLVKWAALSLLAYVLAAFSVAPAWGIVLRHTVLPALPRDVSSVMILAAVVGTTISPYLFIWQSSLEAERAAHLPDLRASEAAPVARAEIKRIRADTCAGMLVATVVAYAVVVTAGSTLHLAGIGELETTAEAAQALQPLAGPFTHTLFSVGILATGLLAIPMLAGSAAYAVGESRGWPIGLARAPRKAPGFYSVIAASTLAGVALNFVGFNPVRVLVWSAVINGVLSVPMLVAMMLVAVRPEIMGGLALTRPLRIVGWLAACVMGVVALSTLAALT